jgi:signal transduction histidine kinase
MRERVAIAGGTLQISSVPERGTTIVARFPLHTMDGKGEA